MSISAIGSSGSYSFIDRMAMNAMSKNQKTNGTSEDLSQMVSDILKKEDSNGDGTLAASETKLDSKMFSTFDSDGDGQLTSDELKAGLEEGKSRMQGGQPPMGPPPMGPPPDMDTSKVASSIMESSDTNGDSTLSIDETDLTSDEFGILDTDSDGKVTSDELETGLKARESERAEEMASLSQNAGSSSSNDSFQSLLQLLSQNDASSAYSSQNSYLQSSYASAKNLALAG